MKPLVIFMAGAPAAGKSEMAYRLSEMFSLPIFSTDSVRNDAKVTKGVISIHDALDEFEKDREERSKAIMGAKKSFIYDGSVDRRWPEAKQKAKEAGFDWVLISFDLTRETINKHRKMFDRIEVDEMYDKWLDDHQKFLDQFTGDVSLHISEVNYAQRYELAKKIVSEKLA